ncbi:MAG: hypothetical protein ACE5GO_06055, partial [Anaerolineales bacterium]
AYRKHVGGTLTVAEPVEYTNGFKSANDDAQSALRAAKMHNPRYVAIEQTPFTAFCASCGVGLAKEHRKLDKENENQREQYLCSSCIRKADERNQHRFGYFLEPFAKAVVGDAYQEYDWAKKPEDVAVFDARNYVAYVLADGNGMGKVFSDCPDKDSLYALSESLTRELRGSLADATQSLISRTGEFQNDRHQHLIPTLPLILAGDDLFALIPAPWALDFARELATKYEERMKPIIKKIDPNAPLPTMGVAVVICKAKYPYYLAHQHGEELLSAAKRLGKRLDKEPGKQARSTVTFDIILGSRLAQEDEESRYRSTLKPYWLGAEEPGWGIGIETLLRQRLLLKNLPHRRLGQVRAFFDNLPEDRKTRKDWHKRLQSLLKRIAHHPDHKEAAKEALTALGGKTDDNPFYDVQRLTDKKSWWGHALPDLLDAWDFAYSLDEPLTAYEE